MAPAFVADRTLGKLIKWLRLMGFDAITESDAGGRKHHATDQPDRLILARTEHIWKRAPVQNAIWIEADDPKLQVRQVISRLNIKYADLEPFTRCLGCNELLKTMPRRDALGVVPDYIWETQARFSQCPDCRQIFWPGSHISRSRKRLDEFFNDET